MTYILQTLIALGILNVWLVRPRKASDYRGGSAKNLQEEFAVYGLPTWFMYLVGVLKIVCAAVLLYGLINPEVIVPAALTLALLMIGAVVMHYKVRDPLIKALPASVMLALCLIVAAASGLQRTIQ